MLYTTNQANKFLLVFYILTLFHPHLFLAAGVAHVALLNANFEKSSKHNRVSEQVRYSLTVEGSLCLTWDDHQKAWTHSRCVTRQADRSAAVSCR